jgi:NADH-quinone oxidoreductase subunit G
MLSQDNDNNFIFFDKLNNNEFKFLYLLGSDNLEIKKNNEFIVYQGSHGDRGAEIADVILPNAAFTEQNGLYSNLEGRIQECKKASYPIGNSLEDWKIFNLILKKLGKIENLNNFETLRKEALNLVVNFSKINELPKKIISTNNKINSNFYSEEILIKKLDYYYTNCISRASKTMNDCRKINDNLPKTGTNN